MKSKRFTEQQISEGLKQAQAGRADQGAMPHTALAMRRSIGNTSAPRGRKLLDCLWVPPPRY
jgi:hypothetical protein